MSFQFYLGNKLLVERSSLIESAEDIKLYATTAHLWFEKIMSGDSIEPIAGVWVNFDAADWHAKAMLVGGNRGGSQYYPLKDPKMRQSIVLVRRKLAEFTQLAQKRYRYFAGSLPGSKIDIEFDKIFRDFIEQAELVEAQVKRDVYEQIVEYQYISFSLIISSALISIILANFLYKREKQRVQLVASLTEASQSIMSKNRELQNLAHYDSLTGLPNRILFLDRLDQAIVHAARTRSLVAILFLDLDHFKAINDRYGHQIGDELLKEVSKRLKQCIRADDSVVRMSGDEFVVILSELDNESIAIETASKVSETAVNVMQQPFQLKGHSVNISVSIGVSIYPTDSTNGEELTKLADKAMYHAKSLGKNNFQFYADELNGQSTLVREKAGDLTTDFEE